MQRQMRVVVKQLKSPEGKFKVEVFRRGDGSFGFESLRFSDAPREKAWIPHGRFAECFADTAERAEREARDRVDWLRPQRDA